MIGGELLDSVASSLYHVEDGVIAEKVSCAKGEKETLVGVRREQLQHPLTHTSIALENQFLSEVIVDFLGHHFFVRSQRDVRHCWYLHPKTMYSILVIR